MELIREVAAAETNGNREQVYRWAWQDCEAATNCRKILRMAGNTGGQRNKLCSNK